MATTHEIEPGRVIDLAREVVGLDQADRRARIVEQVGGRPPERINGYTIGVPELTGDAPHNGELHPDGDELLYLIAGAVTVRLELPDGDRTVEMARATRSSSRRGSGTRSPCASPGASSTSRPARTATIGRSSVRRRPEVHRPLSGRTPALVTLGRR